MEKSWQQMLQWTNETLASYCVALLPLTSYLAFLRGSLEVWPEEGYGTAAARSVVLMAELSAVTTRPELPRHHTLTLGSLTPFFICGYGYPRLVFQEPTSFQRSRSKDSWEGWHTLRALCFSFVILTAFIVPLTGQNQCFEVTRSDEIPAVT